MVYVWKPVAWLQHCGNASSIGPQSLEKGRLCEDIVIPPGVRQETSCKMEKHTLVENIFGGFP